MSVGDRGNRNRTRGEKRDERRYPHSTTARAGSSTISPESSVSISVRSRVYQPLAPGSALSSLSRRALTSNISAGAHCASVSVPALSSARAADAAPCHFSVLFTHPGHQQAHQPLIPGGGGNPAEPGSQLSAASIPSLSAFASTSGSSASTSSWLLATTDTDSSPSGYVIEHAFIYPVQRHFIGERCAVTESQRFQPWEAGQQAFQITAENVCTHAVMILFSPVPARHTTAHPATGG